MHRIEMTSEIVLATLNARYSHASMGLRYLRANLGELRGRSSLSEFVIGQKTEEIAERILAQSPRVLGLGVYIWNVDESTRLVSLLKVVAPELVIVLGGPEVSYEPEQQRICSDADFVISGWGDISFAALAAKILIGQPPVHKLIKGVQPPLAELQLPYREYTDDDLAHRHIYVEASRGCPFKCEFCLSALDKTAWAFPLEQFLQELEALYCRGARQFKFVDRTFNLKVDTSLAILDFFLDKLAATPEDPVFVHFELIPDHLPQKLKESIARFPAGTLQFEIGIQTFNLEVQARISRRQNNAVAEANIRWLRENSRAHLHVDLIAGLPGETMESFGVGFDRLAAMAPQEIQFGILKRLRGAPIARHGEAFDLRFNPDPPYNILSTRDIDFVTMQRLARFSRYWDMVANSGRHSSGLRLLLGQSPFERFLQFCDWIHQQTGKSHAIAHERLIYLIFDYLHGLQELPDDQIAELLIADYRAGGGRTELDFFRRGKKRHDPGKPRGATPARQARHLHGTTGKRQQKEARITQGPVSGTP